jgi:hypothetical protein
MTLGDPRAILGIDPTSRGLAYVFFEDGKLLDWGTRRVHGDDLGALRRILALCPAEILVIEDGNASGCLRRPRIKRVLVTLQKYAIAAGIEVRRVARQDVFRAWRTRGRPSKDDIAAVIAKDFPVLQMILPRARGKYRSEDARIRIFDAASFALNAFGTSAECEELKHAA